MTGFLYDIANLIPLAIAVITSIARASDESWGGGMLQLTVVAVCLGITLTYHQRARVRLIGSMIAAGVFLIFELFLKKGLPAETVRIWSGIIWLCLGCLFCFVTELILQQLRFVKCLVAAGAFAALIILMLQRMMPDRIVVAMVLFYDYLTILEQLQLHWKKEGDTELKKHTVGILPFPLMMLALLLWVRIPDKPYDWQFVRHLASRARIRYEVVLQYLELDGSWGDTAANVGFSEKSGFAAALRPDPYPALLLTTTGRGGGRLYLQGKSFDSFDGRSWNKTDDMELDYQTMDTLQTIAAIQRFAPEHTSDYLESFTATVKYEGIRTEHVFMLPKSIPVSTGDDFQHAGGDRRLRNKRYLSYTMRAYCLNPNPVARRNLAEAHIRIHETDLKEARKKLGLKESDGFTEDALASYQSHIRQVYACPSGISDEMRACLTEACRDAGSDYEKLLCIEKMLSEMKYTTSPGELPDSVQTPSDFLDYFVLQQKKGYCTHYATAFVLLARELGFPARYLQGYSINTRGKSPVVVESGRAHAWPEVYFDDLGWIAFEPTPGYRKDAGWAVSSEPSEQKSDEAAGKYYAEEMAGNAKEKAAEKEQSQDLPDEHKSVVKKLPYPVIALLIIAVFTAALIFLLLEQAVGILHYSGLDNRQKAGFLWKQLLRRLRYIGLVMQEGETLEEFEKRASLCLAPKLREAVSPGLHIVTDYYQEILYADKAVSDSDIAEIEARCRQIGSFIGRYRLNRWLAKKSYKTTLNRR